MTTQNLAAADSAVVSGKDRLLRNALRLDAVASGGLGVLALAADSVLKDLLGTPTSLLVPAGAFLVLFALELLLLASLRRISRPAVWATVAVNLLWVFYSVTILVTGAYPLTGLGIAFVIAQAVAVAGFAELQIVGLRRAR